MSKPLRRGAFHFEALVGPLVNDLLGLSWDGAEPDSSSHEHTRQRRPSSALQVEVAANGKREQQKHEGA